MKFRSAVFCLGLLSLTTGFALAEDDWPQWRGPQREGHSLSEGLLKEWPADGPPVVWNSEEVGVGYSSIIIQDGMIYTQGDLNGIEHVIALDADQDGKLDRKEIRGTALDRQRGQIDKKD
ncbi:MAG: hypothetical protein N2C14_25685, partial [Planctomycetales bacterium]